MTVRFHQVKQILYDAILAWSAAHGRAPNLTLHGPEFGWETREQLLNAAAFGFRVIDPERIGSNQGDQTNLVIALSNLNGVQGFGQMPWDGPYLSPAKIKVIVAWIDDGALGNATGVEN